MFLKEKMEKRRYYFIWIYISFYILFYFILYLFFGKFGGGFYYFLINIGNSYRNLLIDCNSYLDLWFLKR